MELGLRMDPSPNLRWELAQQMGVGAAVVNFYPGAFGETDPWSLGAIETAQDRLAEYDMRLAATESRPPMDDVVLGRDGRDEQIETVKRFVRNLGEAGVDVYCWVWTENPLGVLRTDKSHPDRGGSTQTRYEHEVAQAEGDHPAAGITEAELWSNLEYFLDEIVPVAEEAGVQLALHPDDPPISPIRGVPRIITNVEAYDRILDYADSPVNGVGFCQGNFAAMGVDVPETIRHFGDRLHFAHFRDVAGDPSDFVETWHDDGPTDMAAAIEAYLDIGFDGVIRPDHVADMAGEDLGSGGNKGRLWAIGYMRGLIEQAERQRQLAN